MNESTRYLEAAKIEELTEELSAKGYKVTRLAQGNGALFDLIAEKPGEKIAYEVKAPSSLQSSVERILEQRKRAKEAGYNSIQLVVVNPPHATEAKVEGLEGALATYFMINLPPDLVAFLERWRGDGVSRGLWLPGWHNDRPDACYTKIDVRQVDLDRLIVAAEEIRVVGDGLISGTVQTRERINQEPSEHTIEYEIDTPFRFDVVLDRAFRVIEANRVSVDTSFWDDEETVREPALNSA